MSYSETEGGGKRERERERERERRIAPAAASAVVPEVPRAVDVNKGTRINNLLEEQFNAALKHTHDRRNHGGLGFSQ